jgi:hypothetical protein
MRRILHLLVLLLAILPIAGCEPVAQVQVLTGADLTATALPAFSTASAARATLAAEASATPQPATAAVSPVAAHAAPTATEPLATASATPGAGHMRVIFQPGATSAVRTGHLAPGESHRYLLAARAGQIMSVDLVSEAAAGLAIQGADGLVLKEALDGASQWQGTLPSTQDYYVQISAADRAVDYGLRLTVFARIQFASGATSATVSSPVERLGPEGIEVAGAYVLRAMAGQTMRVTVTSPGSDVLLTITGADGTPLKRYVDGRAEWEGVLPLTQDYYLQPVSAGAAASFTMTVTISPLAPLQ